MMSEKELAYLASIIDGEGCIAIHTRGPGNRGAITRAYVSALKVSNNDIRLLEWIKQKTERGTIYSEKRIRKNRRPSHSWTCSARASVDVLQAVYPYLVIKREQADLVFKFRQTFEPRYCRGGVPGDINAARKGYFTALKELHH